VVIKVGSASKAILGGRRAQARNRVDTVLNGVGTVINDDAITNNRGLTINQAKSAVSVSLDVSTDAITTISTE
jgi:riboflavin biosynthesis pyrimidine reductase